MCLVHYDDVTARRFAGHHRLLYRVNLYWQVALDVLVDFLLVVLLESWRHKDPSLVWRQVNYCSNTAQGLSGTSTMSHD